jgi:3-phosphoshikimate 1-carboxyvinyltransferase
MKHSIAIQPISHPLAARIRPPGSKSITNRALVCAAMADGGSVLTGALFSEDTDVMVNCLRKLGIEVAVDADRREMRVTGCGGRLPVRKADLFVGNSGTTIRFLTAMLAAGEGEFRLDGVARMHERPIGDLAAALRTLGADVVCESPNDCPPLVVRARGLRGGNVTVRGDVSSQFLSGLLMAAPYARRPVEIVVDGALVSRPYVEMTRRVMQAFGVETSLDSPNRFQIAAPQVYQGRRYEIEPDASAASYFWAAAAICGGQVTVEGLSRESLQGDVEFCNCLAMMGCDVIYGDGEITVRGGPLHGIDVDMKSISDTVQTLAAVALFADGPTTVRGVAHIRHKETDRIGDLARELRKLGAGVVEVSDGLEITPGKLRAAEIDTYNDHRMAMSLALPGLKAPGIAIKNPECTAKTYPAFFDDLEKLIDQSNSGGRI